MKKPLYIYTHIPKTAGMTFYESAIKRNFSFSEVFTGYVFHNPHEEYSQLPSRARKKIKIACGHFSFGFHEVLEDRSFQYLTFLRDPVARVVSEYYHIFKYPQAWPTLYQLLVDQKVSLEKYVSGNYSTSIDNLQVRVISGIGCEGYGTGYNLSNNIPKKNIGEIDENDLNIALLNIEKYYAFCGITELYDESILFLQDQLNWNQLYYRIKNVGSRPNAVDKNITKIINERNGFDLLLYNRIKDLLIEYTKKQSFQKRLFRFRRNNKHCSYTLEKREKIWQCCKQWIKSFYIKS